jgi:hypothetical protein
MRQSSSCEAAVAWASTGFEAFDLLVKHYEKIRRMVVGLHFHQTSPDFIEAFLTHDEKVRFVKNTEGVFHPKVYLFEMSRGEWEAIVGSPNFTRSGFTTNDELAVLMSNQDSGAKQALAAIKSSIDGYWLEAKAMSADELESYKAAWRRMRSKLQTVQSSIEDAETSEESNNPPPAPATTIRQWTWDEYYGHITAKGAYAPQHYSVIGRVRVIRAVQSLFAGAGHFQGIDADGRNRIAGTLHPRYSVVDGVNFLWFGSMWPARQFKALVKHHYKKLSHASDAIPSTGPVTKADYAEYADRYQNASSANVGEFAAATRLLAMKRPDTFVCVDAKNRAALCVAFGISRSIGFDTYWDSLINLVVGSTWWNDAKPRFGLEGEVWDARSAFLDAIFYTG